jgi:hypothetical protein
MNEVKESIQDLKEKFSHMDNKFIKEVDSVRKKIQKS